MQLLRPRLALAYVLTVSSSVTIGTLAERLRLGGRDRRALATGLVTRRYKLYARQAMRPRQPIYIWYVANRISWHVLEYNACVQWLVYYVAHARVYY